jgi:rhodanese-related sulfurtransferase
MNVNRIDPAEARGLLESEPGYICLDVRTAEEFAAGHVPAAVNIPVVEKNPMGPGLVPNPDFSSQVEQQFDRDRKIITLCLRGVRSMHAATMMMALGYTEVVDMRGGYDAEMDVGGNVVVEGWTRRNFPTTKD